MAQTEEEKGGEITIVAPNGARRQFAYHAHQTVGHTLDQAVKDFAKDGVLDPTVSYMLVLGDSSLDNHMTLEVAGVTAGAELKIRPTKTPGDGHASGIL